MNTTRRGFFGLLAGALAWLGVGTVKAQPPTSFQAALIADERRRLDEYIVLRDARGDERLIADIWDPATRPPLEWWRDGQRFVFVGSDLATAWNGRPRINHVYHVYVKRHYSYVRGPKWWESPS